MTQHLPRIALLCAFLLGCGAGTTDSSNGGSGGISDPLDIGLLILGHSTSTSGDWPGKLTQSLSQTSNGARNYVTFRAITHGDGGLLWTHLSFSPTDTQYRRVEASTQGQQWCQTSTGVRYAARRARLEWLLTGANPLPGDCVIAWGPAVENSMTCVWHEAGTRHEQTLPFHECWQRMDVRLVLIQDTTNRSWPMDIDVYFNAQNVSTASALPCPANSANPSGIRATWNGTQWVNWVDWNCDNQLNTSDAAEQVYAGWLEALALDLLTNFGASNADHVFISPKPLEFPPRATYCSRWFPSESTTLCAHVDNDPNTDDYDFHRRRAQQTASRPYDYAYLPSVYWERRAVGTLMAKPGLDPRIRLATATASRMWDRSVLCDQFGLVEGDWTIPSTVSNRPSSVLPDNGETDADANDRGCLGRDRIHHTDVGGWMMADVWYAGMRTFLDGLARSQRATR